MRDFEKNIGISYSIDIMSEITLNNNSTILIKSSHALHNWNWPGIGWCEPICLAFIYIHTL